LDAEDEVTSAGGRGGDMNCILLDEFPEDGCYVLADPKPSCQSLGVKPGRAEVKI